MTHLMRCRVASRIVARTTLDLDQSVEVRVIYTRDRDFRRFQDIEVRDPTA